MTQKSKKIPQQFLRRYAVEFFESTCIRSSQIFFLLPPSKKKLLRVSLEHLAHHFLKLKKIYVKDFIIENSEPNSIEFINGDYNQDQILDILDIILIITLILNS